MDQQGHVVEMAQLASDLRGELDALHSPQPQVADGLHPCPIIIGKVRDHTRNVDSDEYDPDHVAIGPYNYPRPRRLLAMEHDKLKRLDMVLTAAQARRPGMPLEVDVYVNKLECLEESVRKCYGNTFPDITSEQFVRMLLLDGCYILSRLIDLQLPPPPPNAGVLSANGAQAPGTANANAGVLSANGVQAPGTANANAGVQSANGAQAPGTANADAGVQSANGAQAPGTANADAGVVSAKRAEDLSLVRDVFYLAENQIPFFVLEKIGKLTGLEGNDRVITATAKYALALMRAQKYAMAAPAMVPPAPTVPGNLLHLLHMHLKPVAPSVSPAVPVSTVDPVFVRRWRSATEYNFAGVKFKARAMSEKGLIRCILDVKLDAGGGTLEVPVLDIDGETWRLLRNLMELEQRNRETVGSHVTAYCVFMSQMACTTKDVELLVKRGVIVHGHGNNEDVAKCFADLCKGIQFDPDDPDCNYLRETCKKLEKRFRSNPRRWTAWLTQRYLRNPWLAVGLMAAAIGLVLALIQTVYSVLCYYKQ